MDLVQAVTQLGFPSAVAAFFIFWVTNNLSKRIDSLGERIERNTETVAYLAVILAKSNGIDPDEMKKYIVNQKIS